MVEGENERAFGVLLRQQRLAAGLTQEALAERAGMGRRSIQHLERGEVQPQRITAHRLAVALALTGEQRAQFEALAGPSPRQRSSREGSGAARAPALDPGGTGRHNLPLQMTSFIGREQELAEVTRLLGTTRLLTLTGTGGTGKTRLALQVVSDLLDRYPQGVWLADLAPLADPAGVPAAVADAVGVREEAGQPLLATLVAALRSATSCWCWTTANICWMPAPRSSSAAARLPQRDGAGHQPRGARVGRGDRLAGALAGAARR